MPTEAELQLLNRILVEENAAAKWAKLKELVGDWFWADNGKAIALGQEGKPAQPPGKPLKARVLAVKK